MEKHVGNAKFGNDTDTLPSVLSCVMIFLEKFIVNYLGVP
jgi:hypothetical protein